jgi:hypothetical protein
VNAECPALSVAEASHQELMAARDFGLAVCGCVLIVALRRWLHAPVELDALCARDFHDKKRIDREASDA